MPAVARSEGPPGRAPAEEPARPGGHRHLPALDLGERRLRQLAVWGIAAVLGLASVVGAVLLWPSGDVGSRAGELGLATERFGADVASADVGACSYSTSDSPATCREVRVVPDSGPNAGDEVLLGEFDLRDPAAPDVDPGDDIVVGYDDTTGTYFFADRDRRSTLTWLLALFVVAVLILARLRGVMALGALALTVAVLIGFVVPSVVDGNSPVLVAVVGAGLMAYVALYFTHGFNLMTTAALLGTLGALAITLLLAVVFFDMAAFSGAATEEALYLPVVAEQIDVKGLILGGVIIGALGALDDVVITQAATVWELRALDPRASTRRVWQAAMRVGREHTGSIINTLLLAYAGASMPILVLFVLSDQSLGSVANSELVAVEIVRTLVGSIGLLTAVPATTALAAYLTEPPD